MVGFKVGCWSFEVSENPHVMLSKQKTLINVTFSYRRLYIKNGDGFQTANAGLVFSLSLLISAK